MELNVNELVRVHKNIANKFAFWTVTNMSELTSEEMCKGFVSLFNAEMKKSGIEKFALPYNKKYPELISFNTDSSIIEFGTVDYKLTCNMKKDTYVDMFTKWNSAVENMNSSFKRGFKWIKDFPENIFELPKRSTSKSAGYDIYAIHPNVFEFVQNTNMETTTLNAIWNAVVEAGDQTVKCNKNGVIILPTGLKAYMQDDEFLMMTVRSSSGIKNGIQQANPPSVIDADYFENKDNDGHIYFAIRNKEIKFDKPIMRIAQGIFMKYLVADNDDVKGVRVGGIGSTGDK